MSTPSLDLENVTPNIYTTTKLRGCNPSFVTTSDGVVHIDTPQLPTRAVAMRAAAESHGPIRYLINTEHHVDHIFGNYWFKGVPVVNHQGLYDNFMDPNAALDPFAYALELDTGGRHRHWVAVRPPSIPRTWPVTNEAASEQKKIAGPTRSRVSPTRPMGMRPMMPALNFGSASSEATCGVSTKVGMIALTRMPCFAHSVAHWRVSEAIAPFAAT